LNGNELGDTHDIEIRNFNFYIDFCGLGKHSKNIFIIIFYKSYRLIGRR
jgi:hypothetical protein